MISRLVREANGEVTRHDVLASEDAAYQKPEFVFCTWILPFKARRAEENPGRALKLTAENLFVTLADPLAEPDEANTPLLQFLALMLERKRVLRPRGVTADGARNVYEHAKSHQRFEVPAGTLDEAFFVKIQGQLDLLVGGPKRAAAPAPVVAAETPAVAEAPSEPAAAQQAEAPAPSAS